jgi:hypothetical protein
MISVERELVSTRIDGVVPKGTPAVKWTAPGDAPVSIHGQRHHPERIRQSGISPVAPARPTADTAHIGSSGPDRLHPLAFPECATGRQIRQAVRRVAPARGRIPRKQRGAVLEGCWQGVKHQSLEERL